MELQKGRLARWPYEAHIFLKDAVAAGITTLPQSLEQLLGGEGVRGQEPHDRAFVRIEFAGPFGLRSWLIGLAVDPFAHGAFIQLQRRRNLRDRQMFVVAQLPDLMKGLIINHAAPPSQARRRMSPKLSAWPVRGAVGAETPWASGKAST